MGHNYFQQPRANIVCVASLRASLTKVSLTLFPKAGVIECYSVLCSWSARETRSHGSGPCLGAQRLNTSCLCVQ